MPSTNLSPITSAHADAVNHIDVEEIDIGALLQDLEFRQAVKEIVEDCIVDDIYCHSFSYIDDGCISYSPAVA